MSLFENIQITPSILSADFTCLKKQLDILRKENIDIIHLDIMDGHFVPNISFGPEISGQIQRAYPEILLEAHLMITDPNKYIPFFIKEGIRAFSLHAEINPDLKSLKAIYKDILLGIAINPDTDYEKLMPYAEIADWFLIMSVQPGFGGQKFNEKVLEKVKKLRKNPVTKNKPIQVDGGINIDNIREVKEAGANLFVVGSALVKAASIENYLEKLRNHIK
ncbi:MAG: ribulose-phosphate 3-epimerase [Candidatus Coatesbacteria bacterium]|nr:ribulose-phosphate 3-epimerase [Candidatus Coatesbacteria bacterium]